MHTPLSPALKTALLAHRAQLLKRVQHLPPVGARPLVIAGKVAGWANPAAQRVLSDLPGVRLLAQALVIATPNATPNATPKRPTTLTPTLAHIAHALRQAGCLRGWRDELLDVVGEGQVLGQMERAAFRPLGLLTQAVRLNAWTTRGELWIARRAAHKSTDPGLWDTLVGGLVAAGETPYQALLRETREEAGLTPTDLHALRPMRLAARLHKRLPESLPEDGRNQGGPVESYLVEDTRVADCLLPDTTLPRNLDGEVDAFCKADPDALWERLKTDTFTAEAAWVIVDSLLGR